MTDPRDAFLAADTRYHCWKAIDNNTPGRLRCTKCGLERWRLDDPQPDCKEDEDGQRD